MALAGYGITRAYRPRKMVQPKRPFPEKWSSFLQRKVEFYRNLSENDQRQFKRRVHEFMLNVRIVGIQTEVDTGDRLLVAASAIIPVFAFPEWRYNFLHEVLLYPGSFGFGNAVNGRQRRAVGLVGGGHMEGKMMLSKPALHQGFENHNDKINVGIHEFLHLIDKEDGLIDGVPEVLLKNGHLVPWMHLMKVKVRQIETRQSDINPYASTREAEFFTVAGEYFFERPKMLKQKHPRLYHSLETIFDAQLASRYRKEIDSGETSRNDPCPCDSGKKYKFCCIVYAKDIQWDESDELIY